MVSDTRFISKLISGMLVGISWASRHWSIYRLDMFLWIYDRYTTTPSVFRELPRSGRSMATVGLCQTQIAHRLLIDCSKIPPKSPKITKNSPKIPKNIPKSPNITSASGDSAGPLWLESLKIEIDDAQEAAVIPGTKNHLGFWCLKTIGKWWFNHYKWLFYGGLMVI